VGGVHPAEERLVVRVLARDEVLGRGDELVVAGLHPLLGQRPGVLDPLPADPAPPRLLGRVVGIGRPAAQHAARTVPGPELGELRRVRVVRELRFLLRVEVVEVAEELVEPVHRRQELVAVAEVVLAELPGGVAVVLQQLGDRRVLHLQSDRRPGDAYLGQAGAEAALPGDERGASGGAGLFAVRVGEPHALVGDPVDVRGAVAHQAVAVAAQVGDPDVVSPDHQDVRLVRHVAAPLPTGGS
jgi:hypothetical protein